MNRCSQVGDYGLRTRSGFDFHRLKLRVDTPIALAIFTSLASVRREQNTAACRKIVSISESLPALGLPRLGREASAMMAERLNGEPSKDHASSNSGGKADN
jgi:hypothetical protein